MDTFQELWKLDCHMCIYGKHIVSINRKKDSQLISLNSLLPCLHMSLEDSVLIWLLKQARTQLQSFFLWAVRVLLMLWGPRSVYTVKLCRHVILMSTKAKSYGINHNILKVKALRIVYGYILGLKFVCVNVCTHPLQTDFHSTSSCKLCWQLCFGIELNI